MKFEKYPIMFYKTKNTKYVENECVVLKVSRA